MNQLISLIKAPKSAPHVPTGKSPEHLWTSVNSDAWRAKRNDRRGAKALPTPSLDVVIAFARLAPIERENAS
jgi:hypothetical protein